MVSAKFYMVGSLVTVGAFKLYLLTRSLASALDGRILQELGVDERSRFIATISSVLLDTHEIIETVSQFWIVTFKILTGYYPWLWAMVGKVGSSSTFRAAFMVSTDLMMSRGLDTLGWFIIAFKLPSFSLDVFLNELTRIAASILHNALELVVSFIGIEMLEAIGLDNTLKIIYGFYVILVLVIEPALHDILAALCPRFDTQSELAAKLKDLSQTTGYQEKNFVLWHARAPEANYHSTFLSHYIFVNEGLVNTLPADQAAAIVAHEIAYRYNWRQFYRILRYLAEYSFKIFFIYNMLENATMDKILGFGAEPSPPIMTLYFIFEIAFPVVDNIAAWLGSCIDAIYELRADRYAVERAKADKLKDSLRALAGKSIKYPTTDNLYSSFVRGHSSVPKRMKAFDGT